MIWTSTKSLTVKKGNPPQILIHPVPKTLPSFTTPRDCWLTREKQTSASASAARRRPTKTKQVQQCHKVYQSTRVLAREKHDCRTSDVGGWWVFPSSPNSTSTAVAKDEKSFSSPCRIMGRISFFRWVGKLANVVVGVCGGRRDFLAEPVNVIIVLCN